MRLNKFISHNTRYSRREADRLILEGKIYIDNKQVIDPATTVDENMKVAIGKKEIRPKEKGLITAVVYNKPKGEIVSRKDDRGRKTIYESLPAKLRGFVPVGRLDYATTGVLILTDSKEVADVLMTSSLERVYIVKIKGDVTPAIERAMSEGIGEVDAKKGAHPLSDIEKMSFAPFYAYKIDKNTPTYSKLKIAISEGKNREIRRFFALFDREVVDLKRVSFGGIELNALPEGKFRYLSKQEYTNLKRFLKQEKENISDNKQNRKKDQ